MATLLSSNVPWIRTTRISSRACFIGSLERYVVSNEGDGDGDGDGIIDDGLVQNPLTAEVREYGKLFTVEDPADAEDWLSKLNPLSLVVHPHAKMDVSMCSVKVYDRFQFERVGYFVVDEDSTDDKKVFNLTVSLRESKEKKTR